MQISFGNSNPASSGVPDAYLNIQPPPASVLAGAPYGIIGIAGTATWGPVNSAATFSDENGGAAIFGPMQARTYDLITQVHDAQLEGANAFYGVRVTDGTDVAASVVVQTNCLTLTGKYTGTRGNSLQAVIGAGTAASSWKITLSLPGVQPEVFDNITGSGNAFWINAAAAINSGQSQLRGASNLVTATAGIGTTAPALATLTFSGGTDGATTITGTVLIGADSSPRTGMYALRNTGLSFLILADLTDATTFTTQLSFAKSELCQAVCCTAKGDTLSNFATTMASAGADDPWIKVLLGDWQYMVDGVNNITRLVSPQAFYAGAKAVAGPHQSALNKSMAGIAGTQKTAANQNYSVAELIQLTQARGDVITAPSPGGAYFSCRTGRNASSDPARHTDAYTTMTNYLAQSMSQVGGLGQWVGQLITPTQMSEAQDSIGGFLQNLQDDGIIQGYSVQINTANNPSSSTTLGIENATILVQYFSVLEYFVVNLTGGQTVVPASTLAAAA